MGILDKLFGREPDRSHWGEIVNNITVGLEHVRQRWFKMCVEGLQQVSSEESPITIKKQNIGGNGLRAVKAYQLFLVSYFLAQHRYIPPSQGRDFADLIFAQVCGSDLEGCLQYFARYEGADGGMGLFRFTSDFAVYITETEAPLMEAMALGATAPTLAHLSHMVLAASFADHQTVEMLQRKLEQGG